MMRHVTDGELHAYLDGGLDALPDDRATEVRRHVDRCEVCASRLEEARAIRARVDEILDTATPDVTGAPSLEELRRLASAPEPAGAAGDGREKVRPSGSRPGSRRPVSGGPLGRGSLRWAATVLVALGAGWLWGITGSPGATRTGPAPGEESASSDGTVAEELTAPGVVDRMEAARGSSSVRDRAGDATGPDPASDGRSAGAVAESEGAARAVDLPAGADRVQVDSLARPVDPTRPVPDRMAGENDVASPTPQEEPPLRAPDEGRTRAVVETPSGDLRASDDPSLADRLAVGWVPLAEGAPGGRPGVALPDSVIALRSPERGGGQGVVASPAGPEWTSLDSSGRAGRPATEVLGLRREVSGVLGGAGLRAARDRPTIGRAPERPTGASNRSIDPGSLTVPGLDVVSVEWTRVAPETTGIRVIQRLVTGGTIELRFGGLTDGSEAPEYLLEERLPEGIRQVVVDFRDGWLVARASLEPEQIRALVALIR